jgi:hypothetical protein
MPAIWRVPGHIKIGLGELGAIYMGARRACELHRANRTTELHSGVLDDLDAAFSTKRAPYCGTLFDIECAFAP